LTVDEKRGFTKGIMKILHLSDLHIGKRVNDYSMIEEQKDILLKIIGIIDDEEADAVIIAGDVYDKSAPSDEAVRVFGDFLNRLAKRNLQVYIISGNHDSAAKLSFASELIDVAGVHIAPEYNGTINKYTLKKDKTKVNIYLLPFVKPAIVRSQFDDDESIKSYTDAVRYALNKSDIHTCAKSTDEINVLVAHQFVTGATRSESEDVSVGGIDNVDASVFDDFDYVALGHIHGPQSVGREGIRYCGTPLKYSFSEAKHEKSVTILDIEGTDINIRTAKLVPKRDLRQIRGTFEELTFKGNYEGTNRDDYVQIILTDEEDVVDAMAKLRVIYKNIMKLTYDNTRTRTTGVLKDIVEIESKQPIELFEEFYVMQNNQAMSDKQKKLAEDIIEKVWGD